MLTTRSLREVSHFSIYNEEIGLGSYFNPRALFHSGRKIHLKGPQEFWDHMKRSQGLQAMHIPPVHHFTAFEIPEKALQLWPYEWEKMRLIPKGKRLLHFWEVLLIYQAHHMGYRKVLLNKERSVNTFYVQDGFVGLAVDIELNHNFPESNIGWICARAIGDEEYTPDIQRIFVGN